MSFHLASAGARFGSILAGLVVLAAASARPASAHDLFLIPEL